MRCLGTSGSLNGEEAAVRVKTRNEKGTLA